MKQAKKINVTTINRIHLLFFSVYHFPINIIYAFFIHGSSIILLMLYGTVIVIVSAKEVIPISVPLQKIQTAEPSTSQTSEKISPI